MYLNLNPLRIHRPKELVKYALDSNMGLLYNVIGPYESLLDEINVCVNFFRLTDTFYNFNFDELRDIPYTYDNEEGYKQQFKIKFQYLNDIIDVLFKYPEIKRVEFFITDNVSAILSDYSEIIVPDHNLTQSLLDAVLEESKRIGLYYYIPTARFYISRRLKANY